MRFIVLGIAGFTYLTATVALIIEIHDYIENCAKEIKSKKG
jgi:hypothetical protein